MSLLELGGNTFTIPVGEVVLGSDAGCAISLSGAGVLPRHAVLQGQADGQVIIRKATPAADVLINGVRLGAEPTPLLHGDEVELGDHELTFVDERRSGSTQYVQALSLPQGAPGAAARPGGKPAAVGTSGGRVVSLTDGREYVITGASLVFGREAGCDVVVSGKDVSRRHAEIVHTPRGYLVVDSSTNGTFVNEEQVQGQRILARTDVIRIGEEQFRFYAEAAPLTPSSALPPGSAVSPEQLKHTVHGIEAVVPPRAPGATVRLGDVQLLFEPTDEKQGVAKGGGTQVLRTPHSSALPGPPAPPASPARSVPPAPAAPAAPVRPPPAPGSQPPPPARPG